MSGLRIGDPAPDFTLRDQFGQDVSLSSYRGTKAVAILFYPYAFSGVCTGEMAGMALGGGCEILLNSDAVQAHAESYVGLVECGVGLIPGWGGCGEMIDRWRSSPGMPKGPMPAAHEVEV